MKAMHGGSVAGFKSILVLYPRTGRGVAIMTNSANGHRLNSEILRSLAREYDWPHFKVIDKTRVELAPETLDAFIGRYVRETEGMTFLREDGHFYLEVQGLPRTELFAAASCEFFTLDGPDTFLFQADEPGRVSRVVRRGVTEQIFQRVLIP